MTPLLAILRKVPGWVWRYSAIVLVGISIYWYGKCSAGEPPDRVSSDGIPIRLTPDEVEDQLPDPDRSIVERFTEVRVVPVAQGGLTNEETLAAVQAYVDAVLERETAISDTTGEATEPPPVYPLVRVNTDKDGITAFGVLRSDAQYIVARPDCEHPCEAGTRDTTMYFDHKRQLGIEFGEYLWQCGGLAAAAAGIAIAADASDQALTAAGVMGGGCVVGKMAW